MKKIIYIVLVLTICSFTLSKVANVQNLQAENNTYSTFDSTMVLHLYYGGGMRYESKNVYIRFDSCIRIDMEQGHDKTTKFAMNDKLRETVLLVMKESNTLKIEERETGFANDKATTSFCLQQKNKKDFCVSSGSSSEISEATRADFNNLWTKLNEFSLNQGKIK